MTHGNPLLENLHIISNSLQVQVLKRSTEWTLCPDIVDAGRCSRRNMVSKNCWKQSSPRSRRNSPVCLGRSGRSFLLYQQARLLRPVRNVCQDLTQKTQFVVLQQLNPVDWRRLELYLEETKTLEQFHINLSPIKDASTTLDIRMEGRM